MIAQLCVYDKNHSTVHFKQANVFTIKLLKKQQPNISNFMWFNLICARSCAVKVVHALMKQGQVLSHFTDAAVGDREVTCQGE